MFPSHRHRPLPDPQRKLCPVCHQAAYSQAGIHPQCAVKLDDGPQSSGKHQAASKVDGSVGLVALGTATAIKAPTESL